MKNYLQRLAIFMCVAIVMCAIPWADGSMVRAEDGEPEKAERCTLDSVTVKISDNTVVFTGGLEPYPVEEETGWNDFFASMELESWEYAKSDACVEGFHNMIEGKINTAGSDSEKESEWRGFLQALDWGTCQNYIGDGEYNVKVSENSLYYDVNFQFYYFVDEQTPEGITVRFARAYDITYDLAGGAFGETTLDRYTAGAQYKVPVPTREGYEFGGWTGTGLAEPTKQVVLPIGTTGDRSYKATWKIAENSGDMEPIPVPTPNPVVGERVTTKKADYIVTKVKKNTVELAYAAPAEGLKKVTVPATVTLKSGQKASVTSIAQNAFKNNKTVQIVTIGKNVKSIGKYAFMGCKNLTKVTIGKNVSSIGTKAFYNSKKLKTIKVNTSKLTLKKVGSKAFKGIHKKARITVPAKKYNSYKTILKKRGIGKKVTVKKQK